jgi:hypothetical protein
MGEGPMTGGGRGLCNPGYTGIERRFNDRGYPAGGRRFMNRGGGDYGAGRGMRFGLGRGYGRRGYSSTIMDAPDLQTSSNELDQLKAQAETVGRTLEKIKQRIDQLEKGLT